MTLLLPDPQLTYTDDVAFTIAIADFLNGPRQGARDLLSHVQSTLSSCPDTKFVLVGYSQGAMVVVNAENDNSLPVDSVVATILYGK
jgi:alpha-beta hydrolase superfamily lysophospholipase